MLNEVIFQLHVCCFGVFVYEVYIEFACGLGLNIVDV